MSWLVSISCVLIIGTAIAAARKVILLRQAKAARADYRDALWASENLEPSEFRTFWENR